MLEKLKADLADLHAEVPGPYIHDYEYSDGGSRYDVIRNAKYDNLCGQAEINPVIVDLLNMAPALIECAEALKTLTHEFELLYAFAISNGIPEAGTPPHLPALAALAKLKE